MPAGPGLQDEGALSLWALGHSQAVLPSSPSCTSFAQNKGERVTGSLPQGLFLCCVGAAAGGLWEAGYHSLPTVLYLHHT